MTDGGLVRSVAVVLALGLLLTAVPLFGQDREDSAEVRPIPRWEDGRVNLGPPPGEKGIWSRTRRQLVIDQGDQYYSARTHLPTDLEIKDVPFQPWAKALYEYRRSNSDRDAPHARCKPSGGPRQIGTAYGFEIVEWRDLQMAIIFDIGGPQSYRIIYMDGRSHPEGDDLEPGYYGHSIGHWEGDTLVVDTVGFNERSWMDAQGLPHTSQLHQIERFTRLDFDTLKYEVTVDDMGAFTEPWTASFLLRWNDGAEMFEYICQENNLNPEMTVGDDGLPLDRTSRIVP